MRGSPRPVWSREPGLCGAGAALPGSATAHSTQRRGWSRPGRIGRWGPVSPGPGGACRRAGHKLRHYDRDVRAALCHVPPVQDGDGEAPGGADRSGDLRRARVAIRGRHTRRATAGCGDGRQLLRAGPSPRPVSASASRCRTPGMTGALPSPPGQCHRGSRTGACTFPGHQILAVLPVLARCRLAAAASSPGAGRIQDHAEGMEVPTGFSAYLPAGVGLVGREIVVSFQLRPAGRGVAAGSAAGVTAAWQRGAAGGAVAGHGADHRSPTAPQHRPGQRPWSGQRGQRGQRAAERTVRDHTPRSACSAYGAWPVAVAILAWCQLPYSSRYGSLS